MVQFTNRNTRSAENKNHACVMEYIVRREYNNIMDIMQTGTASANANAERRSSNSGSEIEQEFSG